MADQQAISPEVQRRITEATEAVVAAERELESAMRRIDSAERADKKIISALLQTAFDQVTAARIKLDDLLAGR